MIGDIGGGILANEIASSFSKVAAKESKTKVCESHLIITTILALPSTYPVRSDG